MILLAAACAPSPLEAEPGSTLLTPEDVEVAWDDAFADDDDAGALLEFEVAVLDPDGLPARGVRVEVTSGWPGARVSAGEADEDDERWVDVRTGRPVTAHLESDGAYAVGRTDGDGAMRFAVFLDSAPDVGNSVPLYVGIGPETRSFDIQVAGL
jgi:hypothetical protein